MDEVISWENSARITDSGTIELCIGGAGDRDTLRVAANRMLRACGQISLDARCLSSEDIEKEISDMEKRVGTVEYLTKE